MNIYIYQSHGSVMGNVSEIHPRPTHISITSRKSSSPTDPGWTISTSPISTVSGSSPGDPVKIRWKFIQETTGFKLCSWGFRFVDFLKWNQYIMNVRCKNIMKIYTWSIQQPKIKGHIVHWPSSGCKCPQMLTNDQIEHFDPKPPKEDVRPNSRLIHMFCIIDGLKTKKIGKMHPANRTQKPAIRAQNPANGHKSGFLVKGFCRNCHKRNWSKNVWVETSGKGWKRPETFPNGQTDPNELKTKTTYFFCTFDGTGRNILEFV